MTHLSRRRDLAFTRRCAICFLMLKHAFATCLTLLAATGPATAMDPTDSGLTHRIIQGWMQADGTYMAGLEVTLAPGWKTYWRSPGDAGIPPLFDWGRARNVSNVKVHWPAPKVFWQSGMRSVGYAERVVLPLSISPARTDQEIRLRGSVSIGVCSDICIPADIDIDATLMPSSDLRAPPIVAALAALPYSESEAGVTNVTCNIRPSKDGLDIEAQITMPSPGGTEQAVVETHDPNIWVSDPYTSRRGQNLTVSAKMMHNSGKPILIDRSRVRITVIGGSYSVDITGCTS